MKSKEYYIDIFSSLNRNHQIKKPAPHKIIYFLAIIDTIAAGFITSYQFKFIPQIISKFLDNWERFVGNEDFYKANVYQPAFYSDSEPFYRLVIKADCEKKTFSSIKGFDKVYEYIEIDEDLFKYIKEDQGFAAQLRVLLISSM